MWNVDNYWLAKNDSWRGRLHLDLFGNENWVKFVADLEVTRGQATKRLLSAPNGWIGELQVPKVGIKGAGAYQLGNTSSRTITKVK